MVNCELCGKPMPPGEEMFKFHGWSGPCPVAVAPKEAVDHPSHYGGKDNPYEHIKVAEAWGLGYHLGNATKYLSRAGKKGAAKEDLKKALWYIVRARTFGVRRPTGELFKLSPTNVAEAWGLSPALANVLEETVAGSYGVAEKRLQEIIDEG